MSFERGLINKSGTHWLDMLDRGLNGYQLYGELQQIKSDIQTLTSGSQAGQIQNLQNLKMVKFGVWVQGKTSIQESTAVLSHAIDNEINGGDLDIIVDRDTIIEGIKCEVDNLKIKAENLSVRASHDRQSKESYSGEVTLTIPIKGNVQGGVTMSGSAGNSNATVYHADNVIIAKGRLEVDIAGDGKISGVKLQASEVLVRAKNLVVESLQDTLTERTRSMEINIGADVLGSLGAKGQVTSRDAAWTNAIGSIIGTQVANVVVQQTLEIAGGLIANAEVDENGKLTDKGKAKVEAGSIIAKQLHDYDNGKSFGLGVTLNRKVDAKGNASWGVGMPVKCSFSDRARDILPTIGQGEVTLVSQGGLEFLNRHLGAQVGTTNGESASLDANVPISDMVKFVQSTLNASAVKTGLTLDIQTTQRESEQDNALNQEKLKLNEYEQQLAKYEALPESLSEEDIKLVAKLRQEVAEEYSHVGKQDQEKAVALAYHIHKEYEKNPDKAPKIQLAMAGAAIPMGIELVSWLSVAVRAALAYISGAVVFEAAKVLLEPEEAKEYDNLYEKRKQGAQESKHKAGKHGIADFGSQMPDPDDFEPDEGKELNKEFKTRNFKEGDNIDLERFSKRIKQYNQRAMFEDPKTGQRIQLDNAANTGSGPHGCRWKLFDKSGNRIGSVNEQGIWLRD